MRHGSGVRLVQVGRLTVHREQVQPSGLQDLPPPRRRLHAFARIGAGEKGSTLSKPQGCQQLPFLLVSLLAVKLSATGLEKTKIVVKDLAAAWNVQALGLAALGRGGTRYREFPRKGRLWRPLGRRNGFRAGHWFRLAG